MGMILDAVLPNDCRDYTRPGVVVVHSTRRRKSQRTRATGSQQTRRAMVNRAAAAALDPQRACAAQRRKRAEAAGVGELACRESVVVIGCGGKAGGDVLARECGQAV